MRTPSRLVTAGALLSAVTLLHCSSGAAGTAPGMESRAEEAVTATTLVWPTTQNPSSSDPWIAAHHDAITQMKPRVLVVNFANGIGEGGNDNVAGGPVTVADVTAKANQFLSAMRKSSTYQPKTHPTAKPFLDPQLVKVVDLQDGNGHANSNLFPRGAVSAQTGFATVGYDKLFTEAYARYWGIKIGGKNANLAELVRAGKVHDLVLVANQVDGRPENPPDQVTKGILEVAFTAQAYDAALRPIPGEFVKNGIVHERQKATSFTYDDDNSMPWVGHSFRIFFLNVSRGVGCLQHSLGHAWEFTYNESSIYAPGKAYDAASPNPFLQPWFRKFADFDMVQRYGAPFASLYAGGNAYTYSDCARGVCGTLDYPATDAFPAGAIANYRPTCGNVHNPPGAASGYDYRPQASVNSDCETFAKPRSAPQPWSAASYDYVGRDGTVDDDCGGQFFTYWYQNMPGYKNESVDERGKPMKNWWPFLYY